MSASSHRGARFDSNLLLATGQAWKLIVGVVLLLAGTFVMWFGLQRLSEPDGLLATFAGLGASLVAIATTPLLVRCPTCRARWVWMAVSKQDHRRWVTWLLLLRTCPRCGYDPRAQP